VLICFLRVVRLLRIKAGGDFCLYFWFAGVCAGVQVVWDLMVADWMRMMLVGGGADPRETLLLALAGAGDGDALGAVSFLKASLR
jgi:hypothetical protein